MSEPLFGDLAGKYDIFSQSTRDPNVGRPLGWYAENPDIPGWYIGDMGLGEGIDEYLQGDDISNFAERFGSQEEALEFLNNPAFSIFYEHFMPESHKGGAYGGGHAADWFRDYGKYLSTYDSGAETLTKRKGLLQAEDWRLNALKSLDDVGTITTKTGFAGDSQYLDAISSARKDALLTRDLQTLGVNASLWDIKDNYLSNLYKEFGNLASVGAYDDDMFG